jgi:conjugal transfer pilus assembly protein TraL
MEQIEIPRHIEDPVHVLLWTLDEVAPIGIGLVAGLFVGSPFYGVLGGWAVAYFYKKFLNHSADGYVLHLFYWLGLTPTKARTTPNPFIKKYLP